MSCPAQSLDSVSLRRVFLLATRELFSHPENFAELSEELSRYKYSTDEKTSSLAVELDYVYNPKNLSARHAVYVGIGDLDFSVEYLDHRAGVNDDRSQHVFVQPAKTSLMIRCVTPLPDESLRLATIALGYFFGMRPLFMQQLSLTRFDLGKLSAPSLVEKAPTALYESVMVATIAFNFEITSTIEGHRIKTFSLATAP